MAVYHLCVKTFSRTHGAAATASAAYRSATKIRDERTGQIYDFTRKRGVVHSEIILPMGVVMMSRSKLWNAAEASEGRKNSTVAREYEVSLPAELDAMARQALALEFTRHLVDRYGVGADLCIHAPGRHGDGRNHHAHILTTTREITPDGFGAKTRILDDRKSGEIKLVRAAWAELANQALARAGHEARVDHRSLQVQGTDRAATIHLGAAASAMERRGVLTERGNLNREITALNQALEALAEKRAELESLDKDPFAKYAACSEQQTHEAKQQQAVEIER